MITRELLGAQFDKPLNLVIAKKPKKVDIDIAISYSLGEAKDNVTLKAHDTAYSLQFDWRVIIKEAINKEIVFNGIYSVTYLINFERDKTEREDIENLLNESLEKLKLAIKNRLKGINIDFSKLRDIDDNKDLVISKIYFHELPKHNWK